MAVRLRVKSEDSSYLRGYVEVDGVDISKRVSRVTLVGKPLEWSLHLTVPLRPGDDIDADIGDDHVSLTLLREWLRS